MKLLLVAINAKYIHSNLAVHSLRTYVLAHTQGKQGQINLAEYTINHDQEEILKGIYRDKAQIVAFSCYLWNIDMVLRLSKELKKVSPEVKIWLGGPEVSYDAKACLSRYPEIEGIIVGEGEQTFLELYEYFVDQENDIGNRNGPVNTDRILSLDSLENIKGLVYRMQRELGEEIIETPVRPPLNLDDIPFPYNNIEDFKNKIIYYESSRGCPYSCSYCLSSADSKVRLRSSELVKKELKLFLDCRVPQVKFVDRTFNCNRKHAMEIWSFLKEEDNGITNFHFEISADLLRPEEIELLSALRPGQVQFEIGIQTTNPDTITAIRRKMDLEQLKENVSRIREGKNIHQNLDLIAGLPLEDYASFERSFQTVYELRPDQLQLGFLKVLKGSPMEEDSRDYHIIYRDTAPYEVLYTSRLSFEEILRLKGVCEMVEVYYNSGQFDYSIRYLEHFYPVRMQLFEKLNQYYEDLGLTLMAHGRLRRYEILLSFYKDKVLPELSLKDAASADEFMEVFEEILLMDLYLREDLKSKPAFAAGRVRSRNLKELYEQYRKEYQFIHIEQFAYDLEASVREGKAVKKETIVLFHYGNRDPLSHSASVKRIE